MADEAGQVAGFAPEKAVHQLLEAGKPVEPLCRYDAAIRTRPFLPAAVGCDLIAKRRNPFSWSAAEEALGQWSHRRRIICHPDDAGRWLRREIHMGSDFPRCPAQHLSPELEVADRSTPRGFAAEKPVEG